MKIAIYTGKGIAAPHINQSAANSLCELGHEVILVPVSTLNQDIGPLLEKGKPDRVLALDYRGLNDQSLSEACIPYYSWFVDLPLYFVTDTHWNTYHTALVIDRSFMPLLDKLGCKQTRYLPLAYDDTLFAYQESNANYLYDVSFVGTDSGDPDALRKTRESTVERLWNALINHTLTLQTKHPGRSLYENFLEVEKAGGVPFSELTSLHDIGHLLHHVDIEMDATHKETCLSILMDQNLAIFGNASWKKRKRLGSAYQGGVSYGEELAQVYRSSKINIVLTRPQICEGVNQRIFDIPACGGFFLSDYHKDLENLYPETWKEITFTNKDDLHDKVRYFLEHPKERQNLVRRCYEAIKSQTYLKRMQEFIDS